MPQFDLSQFSSQIFWLLLCFTVLYLFTYFYLLPRLNKIHQLRHQAIEGKIAKAKEFQDQAEKTLAKYENDLQTERDNAQAHIIEKTRIINNTYHQQKILNDQECKVQYDENIDKIVARLDQLDQEDQLQHGVQSKEVIENLLNTYLSLKSSPPQTQKVKI